MIRTLLIIAGAALVLAIASFGGAAGLAARDIDRHGGSWIIHDGDEQLRIETVTGDRRPDVSRTLAWSGGDRLSVELPADVTYIQGPEAGVVVTGSPSIVDRIRIDNGRLSLADGPNELTIRWWGGSVSGWSDRDNLKIVVTAPAVTRFDLAGSRSLTIRDYDQPSLSVDISGSGEVTATGRTDALDLDIAGSGEADLSALVTTDATVGISGSGEARVAPTGTARLSIAGSGDITLTTRPAKVESNVSGSGDIHQP
jgi:hypothetical protein